MERDRSTRRGQQLRAALAALPVLPFRTWFNRWFRSVSDHVSDVGADTQQVVRTTRDDVVHELRSSNDELAERVHASVRSTIGEIRAEASGVVEVALATERRLARLEAALSSLVEDLDLQSPHVVDGPWIHRALAASERSTIVLPGTDGRLMDELRAAGHRPVSMAAAGTADFVVLDAVDVDDLGAVLESARLALAPHGRVVLSLDAAPSDKSLDGWAVLDERYVRRHEGRWVEAARSEVADRFLYVLG